MASSQLRLTNEMRRAVRSVARVHQRLGFLNWANRERLHADLAQSPTVVKKPGVWMSPRWTPIIPQRARRPAEYHEPTEPTLSSSSPASDTATN